jgi:hypothetical protein
MPGRHVPGAYGMRRRGLGRRTSTEREELTARDGSKVERPQEDEAERGG